MVDDAAPVLEGRLTVAQAARRLGVEPRSCRGYEDTDLGMTSIRSAGMNAVDIRHFTRGPR